MTKLRANGHHVARLCRSVAFLLLPVAMLALVPGGRADPGTAQAVTPALLDSNGDGIVSREEFLRYRLRLFVGREEDRPTWDSRTRFTFTACDTNGDGVLSATEVRERPECGA